eukprot:TRINITY_DN8595_c0_g1_i1.p1 TRINITY_DN8595_c0_g1~~TRINITY_DN8595_c0_g1_i1.p1  ORF type:complete len:711 (+),score=40.63 TRINITY_DN8595_c0_g1_i1:26-2134(+)
MAHTSTCICYVFLIWNVVAVFLSEADVGIEERHRDGPVLLQLKLDHDTHNEQEVKPEDSLVGTCFSSEKKVTMFDVQGAYLQCNANGADGCPDELDAEVLMLPNEFEMSHLNPSVVRLSDAEAELNHLRTAFPGAKFAMTLRRHYGQCSRLIHGTHESKQGPPLLVFLDTNFCVLASLPLNVLSHVTGFAEDTRLFVREGKLLASYVMWQDKPSWGPDNRTEHVTRQRGLWLAPVLVQRTGISQTPFAAFLDEPNAVRLGADGERNYGLFISESHLNAVTWLSPARNQTSERIFESATKSYQEAATWHNNVNFVSLDNSSGDLFGIMHTHRDDNGNATVAKNNPFLFGYTYSHVFIAIQGEPPFAKTRTSKEFCIRASNGKCESVQFVMAMEPLGDGRVLLAYGANDCTAKLALLNVSVILQMLQPVIAKEPVIVKRVNAAIPVLRDFAEVLAIAPSRLSVSLHQYDKSWFRKSLNLGRLVENFHPEQLETCREPSGPYAGWPVCAEWLPRSNCVMYDVGEGTQRKAAEEIVAEHGCEAHAFDPRGQYVRSLPDRRSTSVSMNKTQLDSGALQESALLESLTVRSVHKRIDILKIECNGCEWEVLQALMELAPHALSCVRTILVRLSMRREFLNTSDAQQNVLEVVRFTRNKDWKIWFARKYEWLTDRNSQELEWWSEQGGDGQAYDIGFVNHRFDASMRLN